MNVQSVIAVVGVKILVVDQTPSSISRRSRIVTALLDAPNEIVAALDN